MRLKPTKDALAEVKCQGFYFNLFFFCCCFGVQCLDTFALSVAGKARKSSIIYDPSDIVDDDPDSMSKRKGKRMGMNTLKLLHP